MDRSAVSFGGDLTWSCRETGSHRKYEAMDSMVPVEAGFIQL